MITRVKQYTGRIALAFGILVSPTVVMQAGEKSAYAASTFINDYPDMDADELNIKNFDWWKDEDGNKKYSGAGELLSSRSYAYRNCTDGGAYWSGKYTEAVPGTWGNAKSWNTSAAKAKKLVKAGTSNDVEPGDIAQDVTGDWGHVGFETEVEKNKDGAVVKIRVAELNKDAKGGFSHEYYATRNAAGNLNRGGVNDWDNFIDMNGSGKGLNNEPITPKEEDKKVVAPPPLQTNPTVVNGQALHILGRGIDHEFYDKAWNGKGWNDVQRLLPGSVFTAGPVATTYADETHVFGRGTDGEFYKTTLSSAGPTPIERLQPGAVFAGKPVAISYNGWLHVFGRGTDSELYDIAYTGKGWDSIQRVAPGSRFTSDPAVAAGADGLHLIAKGTDRELYEDVLLTSGVWTGVARIAAGSVFAGDPVIAPYAGELHLVARGIDNELYKDTLTSIGWTGFNPLAPGSVFQGNPDMAVRSNELTIVGRGVDNEIHGTTWDGKRWSAVTSLARGAIFKDDPDLVGYADELQLVDRGTDNELYKAVRTSTGWTPFSRLAAGSVFEKRE